MNGQNSNTQNEIIIKSVKPRYINITEDIFNSLNPRTLKIYLALRFEADYSSKNSCVNKKIQFLINKTKISRTNVFESLNELEKLGLLLREQNKGYQSTFWVAQDLNYFNDNESVPVQNTDDPIQNTDTPVQNTDDIINNTFNNNFIKESITFSNTKESESEIEEIIQKAQECLEKTKENLPSKASEIVPYKYQETNLPSKVNLKPLTVLQEINSLGLPDEYLDELIKIRKVNGGKVTPKAMKAVYQELIKLKKAGLDLNECLSMYANCGWKGFVADWFINAIKGKKNPYDFYTSNDTSWGDEMKNDPFFQGMLG